MSCRKHSRESLVAAHIAVACMFVCGCAQLSESKIGASTFRGYVQRDEARRIVAKDYRLAADDIAGLYRKAHEVAAGICDGYVVVSDTYRDGTEATSIMLGTQGPWIDLRVRCPRNAWETSTNPAIVEVDKVAKTIPESAYFESHAEDFNSAFDRLFSIIEAKLERQGDRLFIADRATGTLITGRARHGPIGFPLYEQYVIVLQRLGERRTRMGLKLLVHVPNFAGVSAEPRLDLVPVEREFVYRRAAAFVEQLREDVR